MNYLTFEFLLEEIDSLNSSKLKLGALGEEVSRYFFQKSNFEIIKKNFYCRSGEIDLIISKDNKVYFVEVKTRKNFKSEKPGIAVGFSKKKKMVKSAYIFLSQYPFFKKYQQFFSVVSITIDEFKLRGEVSLNAFRVDEVGFF